jgi:putative ABC transport system permease protein
MEGFLQDFRYAARKILRAPFFSVAVVLTVALAIAANTSIFSFVNTELIRPMPFRNPQRLVQISEKNDRLNLPNFGASVLNFLSWREQQHSFQEIAGVGFNTYTITGSGDPEQVYGNLISPALMRVLGLNAVAGRAFTDDEEKPGATPVAMISEGLWKRRFGGSRAILGETVNLNGQATTIVGIAPAALSLISAAEVYTPLTVDPAKELRLNHVLIVFGRLKDRISMQQAQSEMDAISARLDQTYPEMKDWGIHLFTMHETFTNPDTKTGLLVLLCAVFFVLLIACANIANLLLSRAVARQQEMAVRTAAGASRARLIRQLLIESVTLALVGGGVGMAAAFGAMRMINSALPATILVIPDVHVDGAVLLFALAVTVLTGLLFGIAPAWRMSKLDINDVFKQTGRSFSGTRTSLRNGLAAAELALATVLLIGAGLLIRTLSNLEHAHVGFDSHGLITFQLALPTAKYPLGGQMPHFYHELLDSIQATPGVQGAAVSSGIPFGAGSYTTSPVIAQQSVLPPGTPAAIDWRMVSGSYFKTMSIPLLRGREFTFADGPDSLPVAIVSQDAAKKLWGNADPVGRTFYRAADPNKTAFTVVGVVGDVRNTALNQQAPALYYPLAWRTGPIHPRVVVMDVVVRTSGSPEALVPVLRQKVRELDGQIPLANIRTMEDWMATSAAQPRLNARLLTLFAALALLIAGIGIYAVLAYSVTQRTREIGLRIALGAQANTVLRLVVSEGMRVGLAGIAIGLVAALAAGRALSSIVYGVAVRDPATFVSVAIVLTVIALAACFIPARRAAKVDPMVALRYE